MRHNLPVLVESPRTSARPRARRLIALLVVLTAACSFIWGMAPAGARERGFPTALGEVLAAAAPDVEPIAPQTAIVGKLVHAHDRRHGNRRTSKRPRGLPAWLGQPTQTGHEEAQWEMEGTPGAAEPETIVHLLATNKAKEPTETSFQLTVKEAEAAPTIEVAEQTATVGEPFSMVVEGARLHELVATSGLPPELTLTTAQRNGVGNLRHADDRRKPPRKSTSKRRTSKVRRRRAAST